MNQQIPQTPFGVADTRLELPAALGLAEEALATPKKLMSSFNMQKVHAEVTQRYPTGFSYRSYLSTPVMKMRMNDGYVVATDAGNGTTRLSFHENKRWLMMMGLIIGGSLLIFTLLFFLVFKQGDPQWNWNTQRVEQSGFLPVWSFFIILVVAGGLSGWQLFESLGTSAKTIELFNQRQMYPGGAPGMPGQPQPGFPGQGQPGFPGQPQPGGYPPQPQPGGFAPPQPQGGFPPPPQGGFPPPPQPAFPPAQPAPQPDLAKAPATGEGTPEQQTKIAELVQMRDAGLITPEDFEATKANILRNAG